MIIPTVSLPHYPTRPCRPQGGFGLVIMMMMMVVMVTQRKCKDIQGDDKDNYYDIENDDDQLVN